MSTSRSCEVPIEFMSGEANVLWELRPKAESDAGFHFGADISMLSQYEHEEEVLFPPCTMMVVQGEPPDVSNSGRVIKDSAKAFLSIKVQPQFV